MPVMVVLFSPEGVSEAGQRIRQASRICPALTLAWSSSVVASVYVWDTSSPSPRGRTALCCHHDRLDLGERPGPFPFLAAGPGAPERPAVGRRAGTFTSIPVDPGHRCRPLYSRGLRVRTLLKKDKPDALVYAT